MNTPNTHQAQVRDERGRTWRRAAGWGGALGVLLTAVVAGIGLSQEPAPPDTLSSLTAEEEAAAIEAFLNPIPLEVARKDPQFAADEVFSTLMMMQPELGLAERRKDPAFVEAEQKAMLCIRYPEVVEAELQKDPEFRRQQEQAFQALATGADQ